VCKSWCKLLFISSNSAHPSVESNTCTSAIQGTSCALSAGTNCRTALCTQQKPHHTTSVVCAHKHHKYLVTPEIYSTCSSRYTINIHTPFLVTWCLTLHAHAQHGNACIVISKEGIISDPHSCEGERMGLILYSLSSTLSFSPQRNDLITHMYSKLPPL
jgi:hypothetical protein